VKDILEGNNIKCWLLNKKTLKMELKSKKCVPCEGGVPKLSNDLIAENKRLIHSGWELIENSKLRRSFKFVNFKQTMEFVNEVAYLAENEGHHPDMYVSYGSCVIELWTHALEGLSENDFILAAKIDELG
jgi:4a-hydroxytetrahydrobiopterin dehydratase